MNNSLSYTFSRQWNITPYACSECDSIKNKFPWNETRTRSSRMVFKCWRNIIRETNDQTMSYDLSEAFALAALHTEILNDSSAWEPGHHAYSRARGFATWNGWDWDTSRLDKVEHSLLIDLKKITYELQGINSIRFRVYTCVTNGITPKKKHFLTLEPCWGLENLGY